MQTCESKKSWKLFPFQESDIGPALSLWRQCEHIGLSSSDTSTDITCFLERNPGCSFVVPGETELAGAILCGHDGRRGYIYHLAVAHGFRRQGLGEALLNASVKALREQKIHKCHAVVFSDNPNAELFWEKQGWHRRTELMPYSAWTGAADTQ